MKNDSLTWDMLRSRIRDGGADAATLDTFDKAVSRRQFLGGVGRSGAALVLLGFGAGESAAIKGLFGRGLIPVAWADEANTEITDEEAREALTAAGKEGLIVHSERPINAEPPPHLLGDPVTPIKHHFIRNNDLISARAFEQKSEDWKLRVDGAVRRELEFTLDDLQRMKTVTIQATIECGGNGRAFFDPPVRGNQWRYGAIGCSRWTGVPLRELLLAAGLKANAVYTAHYGEEPVLGDRPPFSRGIPIAKAMEKHTLIAFKINGEDLPAVHGYPVRLVVPGWYGSASHKWLNRIQIRDREHDGRGMTGYSYRMPAYPVKPGERPPAEDMVVGGPWPVKSVITDPVEDSTFKAGETVKVRGHAWAGENAVKEMYLSIDFGLTWLRAKLDRPVNRYAWQQWRHDLRFADRGYYEIWARAVGERDNTQPIVQPCNPRGYEGNAVHRLPIMITT